MDVEQAIDLYVELFRGNEDYYGANEGACIEATHDWPQVAEWHLTGEIEPIGVYPAVPDGTNTWCRWGCVDFDEGWSDSFRHARNLRAVLGEFAIRGWIERSRSKGYHVWVFLEYEAYATTVRRALLAACQIADAPTKEINPKQDHLTLGKVGNYVRLPYPGCLAPGAVATERQSMVRSDDGTPIELSEFVEDAWDQRDLPEDLVELVGLYTPPKVLVPERNWKSLEGSVYERMLPLARTIYNQGPREDQPITDADGYDNGRSSRLWKLACLLREGAQHSVDEAIQLVREADARWGKFSERGADGDRYIEHLVAKAWGRE